MASSKTEIQAAAIARGTDKQTGETFFVVRSDSDSSAWYHLTWNDNTHDWNCTCPAGSHGRNCKHQAAVNLVLRTRRLAIAQASRPAPVAARSAEDEALRFTPWHGSNRDEDTRQAEASHRPSQKGTLSSNRGFSLLK